MVQVDLPGAFAAGQILAIVSAPYLRRERAPRAPRTAVAVFAYFTFVYAPVGAFLLAGWPAWESMYWWTWVEEPAFHPWVALFDVAFTLSMVGIGIGSYFLAHRLYRRGADRTVLWLAALGVVATALPFFLWPLTWIRVGTHAQYHAVPRGTFSFLDPRFFVPWLCVMSWLAVGTIAFGLWLRRRAAALAEADAGERATPRRTARAVAT